MHATTLVVAALAGSALAVVRRQYDDGDSDADADSDPYSYSYSMDASDISDMACATAMDAIVSGAPPIPSDVVSYIESYVEYGTAVDECHISMPASLQSQYSSYMTPYSSWYDANSADIHSLESKCGYVEAASYYSQVCATDTILSASSRATATAGATATATDGTTASDKTTAAATTAAATSAAATIKATSAKATTSSTGSGSTTATASGTAASSAVTGAAARDSVMVGAALAAVGLLVVAL